MSYKKRKNDFLINLEVSKKQLIGRKNKPYDVSVEKAKNEEERSIIISKLMIESPRVKKDIIKAGIEYNDIKALATKLGLIKEYENGDLDFRFEFSKNSLKESKHIALSKRSGYRSIDANMRKMFSIFDKVIENAKVIEVHSDIYKGKIRQDDNLENVYVLISSFNDTSSVYPVEMLIKKFKDRKGKLHMILTIGEIKKVDIMPPSYQTDTSRSPSTIYNVVDLIRFVNDGDFLKYVPNDLLTNVQIELKEKAIEKEKKRILLMRKSI